MNEIENDKNPSPVSIPMVSEGRAITALRQIDALGKSPGHIVPLALRDLVADALKDSPAPNQGATYTQAECDEMCEIAERDGYEKAVQEIDQKTGGDGEYRYCLGMEDSVRHTPDAATMIQRIVDRFEVLDLLDQATKDGSDQPDDSPVSNVVGLNFQDESLDSHPGGTIPQPEGEAFPDDNGRPQGSKYRESGDSQERLAPFWQPIATAPKSGEEIIGRTGQEWGGFSCRWNGEVFIHVDGDDGYISYGPTEWMRMPAPGSSPVAIVMGSEPTLANLDDAKHQLAAVALRKAADEIERLQRVLICIAHAETEDSHGNSKDMPSGYYRNLARVALEKRTPAAKGNPDV